MNGYKAFWRGKSTEVYADTSFQAQRKAAEFWRVKPNKQYEITVVLCEKSGEQVTHVAVD